MVWHALLQSTNVVSLALVATTLDRIAVWGALVVMIGLIAWREYTLPDVSLPEPDAERTPDPEIAPGPGNHLRGVAPADALTEAAGPPPEI